MSLFLFDFNLNLFIVKHKILYKSSNIYGNHPFHSSSSDTYDPVIWITPILFQVDPKVPYREIINRAYFRTSWTLSQITGRTSPWNAKLIARTHTHTHIQPLNPSVSDRRKIHHRRENAKTKESIASRLLWQIRFDVRWGRLPFYFNYRATRERHSPADPLPTLIHPCRPFSVAICLSGRVACQSSRAARIGCSHETFTRDYSRSQLVASGFDYRRVIPDLG